MNEPIKVEIELVHEDSHPLHRSTKHAAGYDIYSIVNEEIPPLGWKTIPTGVKIKSMPSMDGGTGADKERYGKQAWSFRYELSRNNRPRL